MAENGQFIIRASYGQGNPCPILSRNNSFALACAGLIALLPQLATLPVVVTQQISDSRSTDRP
jgi:hypothetical protein